MKRNYREERENQEDINSVVRIFSVRLPSHYERVVAAAEIDKKIK